MKKLFKYIIFVSFFVVLLGVIKSPPKAQAQIDSRLLTPTPAYTPYPTHYPDPLTPTPAYSGTCGDGVCSHDETKLRSCPQDCPISCYSACPSMPPADGQPGYPCDPIPWACGKTQMCGIQIGSCLDAEITSYPTPSYYPNPLTSTPAPPYPSISPSGCFINLISNNYYTQGTFQCDSTLSIQCEASCISPQGPCMMRAPIDTQICRPDIPTGPEKDMICQKYCGWGPTPFMSITPAPTDSPTCDPATHTFKEWAYEAVIAPGSGYSFDCFHADKEIDIFDFNSWRDATLKLNGIGAGSL